MTPGTLFSPVLFFCAALAIAFGEGEGETENLELRMPGVETDKPDAYMCRTVPVEDPEYARYLVGFDPHGSMKTAHHILVYGCTMPGSEDLIWNCGEMNAASSQFGTGPVCSSGSQIIYAWAKDAPQLELPEGVGFKVGGDSGINYLVVQVHYMHPMKEPDYSGVTAQMTFNPQPRRAGVLLMVTDGQIQPHKTEHFETACVIDEPVTLHPFRFRTHAHKMGKVVSGWKVVEKPNGKDQWRLIGKHDPQKPQMFYPVADPKMTIKEGDIVAARCFMESKEDHVVRIGATGEDEMCNFYMMYYVDGDRILSDNTCFSPGPPNYYWKTQGGLNSIPDKSADTLN
jgi:peptidylglycine monooxygenase